MRKIRWIAAIAVMLSIAAGALVTSTWGTPTAQSVAVSSAPQFDILEAMGKSKAYRALSMTFTERKKLVAVYPIFCHRLT
jgi:hypothetical protein